MGKPLRTVLALQGVQKMFGCEREMRVLSWTAIFISLWRLVSLCERTVGVGIYACDDGGDGATCLYV